MGELEMWRLQSFLVLAGELHFGRAAERLAVTQPTLSRQIQSLEAHVGVPLLVRGSHGVSLTEAGWELRREGERLVELSARAVDRTRRAARGDLGHVSVGFVGSAVETVVRCVATMHELHPDVAFTLSERSYSDPTSGLVGGDDDLVIARDLAADSDWQRVQLDVEQSYLVAASSHPISRCDRIDSADVEALDEVFISTRRWMNAWGFNPRRLYEVHSPQAALQLVGAGVGVALMPAGYQSLADDSVRFIPVNGMTSTLQAALPRRAPSPATRAFLRILVQGFEQPEQLLRAALLDCAPA
ncbi:LysR family transcriptional regulator [Microbacterium aurantiacum]|uniref:LysR family transcriptional regulator n=1 Tax=Microbacterium aurantiacum TaxID=162393 RepID=A0AAJ2HLI9_9MICO|nr:LysR substrate-binding domain-containing protein [Microbacterium aurantiacum]MDS0246974.1 LysR family transcriptional regulator [Microbacterium aurantiacum]